jgi:hypothetical protein
MSTKAPAGRTEAKTVARGPVGQELAEKFCQRVNMA